jgi:hypothetical protein
LYESSPFTLDQNAQQARHSKTKRDCSHARRLFINKNVGDATLKSQRESCNFAWIQIWVSDEGFWNDKCVLDDNQAWKMQTNKASISFGFSLEFGLNLGGPRAPARTFVREAIRDAASKGSERRKCRLQRSLSIQTIQRGQVLIQHFIRECRNFPPEQLFIEWQRVKTGNTRGDAARYASGSEHPARKVKPNLRFIKMNQSRIVRQRDRHAEIITNN